MFPPATDESFFPLVPDQWSVLSMPILQVKSDKFKNILNLEVQS